MLHLRAAGTTYRYRRGAQLSANTHPVHYALQGLSVPQVTLYDRTFYMIGAIAHSRQAHLAPTRQSSSTPAKAFWPGVIASYVK